MTVKKILATQLARLTLSVTGFALSTALIYLGFVIDQSIALSAGLLGVTSSLVLIFMDLTIFIRATTQILDLVEPIYAAQFVSTTETVSPTRRLNGITNTPALQDEWSLELAFIEPPKTSVSLAPIDRSKMSRVRFGSIEIRTFSANDHESELERLERISKEIGPTGLRKNLLISAVGTALVDESSLGDFVDGHLPFKQIAYPEILPGFDLLAADSARHYRRPSTLKEALTLAAKDYDRTILIIKDEDLKHYENLFASESKAVRADAVRL